MKRITILGSTGSIGQSTLDVISRNRSDYRAVALVAGRNIDLLEDQISAFNPEVVAVADEKMAETLSMRVKGTKILFGPDGINQAAAHETADVVISAIVGSAGLLPTLTAIRAGKDVGLANKEALVMAGGIVMAEARKNGVRIIPVDSEHSAVFQCLEGRKKEDLRKIVLTASGGPFVNKVKDELEDMTATDALKHPNWSMGRKISIDSATLMNKGLEVIEACWLFDISPDLVDVLIHPQSIVHSMVEFRDRTFLAQLSMPDMRAPIAYALSWPDRLDLPIQSLELDRIGQLTFKKPDHDSFPCLTYAYEAIRQGGTAPAVLNAANEVAVHAFLDKAIGFNDIPAVIRKTVMAHKRIAQPSLDEVIAADRWARLKAGSLMKEIQQ
ncbi:MAG: 1-deoxy-D-xylulose-5-phosphate reductoisomerase [Nitrospirae bacterium]|nr:1-deoxy-D-xylulose-5-phosphate reductoisomerase [Nitrospirota bacterium]